MSLTNAGRIQRPHGVDGEVTVVGDDRLLGHLLERRYWLIGFDPEYVLHVRVESARIVTSTRGKAVLARLWCADSRTEAARLRGANVYVPASDVPEIESDENPFAGFVVVDGDDKELGTVIGYRRMPAQNLIVARMHDGKEVLIPDTPAIVKAVNPSVGIITIHVVDGLLEI